MDSKNDKKALRKHLFVDPQVQGALVMRVVMYWCVCAISLTLMLLCWQIVTGPARLFYKHFGDLWLHYGPVLVAAMLLLPLVVIDIIRLTNRFAGPLFRLRRSMRALARGESVEPLEFRDSDFWQDFAGEFNAVLARVQPPAPVAAETDASAQGDEPVEFPQRIAALDT